MNLISLVPFNELEPFNEFSFVPFIESSHVPLNFFINKLRCFSLTFDGRPWLLSLRKCIAKLQDQGCMLLPRSEKVTCILSDVYKQYYA